MLGGTSIVVAWLAPGGAGAARQALAPAVLAACAGLGASAHECVLARVPDADEELGCGGSPDSALAEAAGTAILVVDAASVFGGAGAGREGLRACLALTWRLTRELAAEALLPRGRGGRIIYLAPAPGAGTFAPSARAGLENLARTLSIEWARHELTTVSVAPGAASSAGEVAALVAYLASPAGAYFSGCVLELR